MDRILLTCMPGEVEVRRSCASALDSSTCFEYSYSIRTVWFVRVSSPVVRILFRKPAFGLYLSGGLVGLIAFGDDLVFAYFDESRMVSLFRHNGIGAIDVAFRAQPCVRERDLVKLFLRVTAYLQSIQPAARAREILYVVVVDTKSACGTGCFFVVCINPAILKSPRCGSCPRSKQARPPAFAIWRQVENRFEARN